MLLRGKETDCIYQGNKKMERSSTGGGNLTKGRILVMLYITILVYDNSKWRMNSDN